MGLSPSPISQSRLRELAQNDDVELRVDRNQAPKDQLQTREGSWVGRVVRWFSTPPSKDVQRQNIDAKTEVWRTLNEMYGEEIGTKVFRANIGHMQGDRHVSSQYHPITGRHIRQMIEQGDRALQEKYGERLTDPRYEMVGGVLQHRRERQVDPEDFKRELLSFTETTGKLEKLGTSDLTVCHQFNRDVANNSFEVELNGRSVVLNKRNAPEILQGLVAGGTDDQNRTAIENLSRVVNQSLGNVLHLLLHPVMRGFEPDSSQVMSGGMPGSRFQISRDEQTKSIRIDVDYLRSYRRAGESSDDDLDPKSIARGSYSITLPLEDLRKTDGYKAPEITVPPQLTLQLAPRVGQEYNNNTFEHQKNVMLSRDGDRVVSQRILNSESSQVIHQRLDEKTVDVIGGEYLNTAFGNGLQSGQLQVTVHQDDQSRPLVLGGGEGIGVPDFREQSGLTPDGLYNLSRLLSPNTTRNLHEHMMKEILQDPSFETGTDGTPVSTTIAPITLDDGRQALEIELRGAIPRDMLENNSPSTVLHYGPGDPPGPMSFDTVVRLRVPVDELNRETLPEMFDFITPWRLEGRPVTNQI